MEQFLCKLLIVKQKQIFLFVILTFGSLLQAQQLKFVAQDSVPGNFSSFSVDNFGRIALVKNDVIISFSNKLDTLFSTSLKAFRPFSIESSKSFRTLVFDQERSVIHFLDNTMTDIHGEIDLVNLDIQQPWLVCESFGGNTIWIFDAGAMRLIRLNENLDKLMITENLASVFSSGEFPIKMMEAHDRLFIQIPSSGIAVFDVFGTYITTYPVTAKTFDVFNNYLLTYSDLKIAARPIDFDGRESMTFDVPQDLIQFKFTTEKVYLLTTSGLYIGTYLPDEK